MTLPGSTRQGVVGANEKRFRMANQVVNYDGSITASPQQLVYPQTVADIQAILRDPVTYPSPVRAVGNYHSLTACASSHYGQHDKDGPGDSD